MGRYGSPPPLNLPFSLAGKVQERNILHISSPSDKGGAQRLPIRGGGTKSFFHGEKEKFSAPPPTKCSLINQEEEFSGERSLNHFQW